MIELAEPRFKHGQLVEERRTTTICENRYEVWIPRYIHAINLHSDIGEFHIRQYQYTYKLSNHPHDIVCEGSAGEDNLRAAEGADEE